MPTYSYLFQSKISTVLHSLRFRFREKLSEHYYPVRDTVQDTYLIWYGSMYTRFIISVVCNILFCKYEHPTDPLANQRISSRSSRVWDHQENEISQGLYDFSKGDSNPIVSPKPGKLEGYIMKSIKGRSIYAFEGIPYGKSKRFEVCLCFCTR